MVWPVKPPVPPMPGPFHGDHETPVTRHSINAFGGAQRQKTGVCTRRERIFCGLRLRQNDSLLRGGVVRFAPVALPGWSESPHPKRATAPAVNSFSKKPAEIEKKPKNSNLLRKPCGPSGFFVERREAAGVAHAISPDVRCGHPALRSLEGNLASPSWLRSVSYAARLARATPPTHRVPGRTNLVR
jgi:hypothetical protein